MSTYTGKHGELNFEHDIVDLLIQSGWESKIIKNPTMDDLVHNWKDIILERNRSKLNNVPLSDNEMMQLRDIIKQQANTPVKANVFLNTADRGVVITRDKDSEDMVHADYQLAGFDYWRKPYSFHTRSTQDDWLLHHSR